MKKLMLTAAAAAMATGAFAAAPAVYDYKASVKHMYLKEVNVTLRNLVGPSQTVKVYQKYQKSATLKGYLIWDVMGATSTMISGAAAGPAAVAGRAVTTDHLRNRVFLVVQNSSAEAQVRRPKILPGTLKAKWFDTKYNYDLVAFQRTLTSGVAEGVLFLGGDVIAPGAPTVAAPAVAGGKEVIVDRNNADGISNSNGDGNIVATGATTPYLLLDYGWTSIYLFGRYNGANGSNLWRKRETRLELSQKVPGYTAGNGRVFYHDTWMNGTGIGKYIVSDDSEECCGFQVGGESITLDSLSGNLKGGLFLCSENGWTVKGYNALRNDWWEDQFYTRAAAPGDPGIYLGAGDYDQPDVWTDGEIDQNTSDVLFGTWSIKKIAASKVRIEPLTKNEFLGIGVAAATVTDAFVADPADTTTSGNDLKDLNEAIKGAALSLNSKATFAVNGRLIPVRVGTGTSESVRQDVPLMDANFATAYGLNHY